MPEEVKPSPWEKGKHPHPLSQILWHNGDYRSKQVAPPQRRAFAESGAVNAVSLYDPICEKAIQENPQIFLNCNYKINFPLNMPRAKRRASKIVPA